MIKEVDTLIATLDKCGLKEHAEEIKKCYDALSEKISLSNELIKQTIISNAETGDFEKITHVLSIPGEVENCINLLYPEVKKEKEKALEVKKHQFPKFSFAANNIQIGDELVFTEDNQYRCFVHDGRDKVEFESKVWSLAGLTKELKERLGTGRACGTYQGSCYFSYKDKPLSEIHQSNVLSSQSKK